MNKITILFNFLHCVMHIAWPEHGYRSKRMNKRILLQKKDSGIQNDLDLHSKNSNCRDDGKIH